MLLDLARSLWLRAGPSLRAVIDRYGREAAPDLHREALVAMRAGDAKGLARAIEADIQQGVDHVRQALAEGSLTVFELSALRREAFVSPSGFA